MAVNRESDLARVTVREATEDDAVALRDYAARLFSEDLPGIFRRPIPSLDDELAYIRTRTAPANAALLIAELDGVPLGLVDLLGATLAEEAHTATFGISVDREWRGSGIGSALIDALKSWADAHGIMRIQGYVWATNPRALAFYERHGFVREGVCKAAVIRDGAPIDVVAIATLRSGLVDESR